MRTGEEKKALDWHIVASADRHLTRAKKLAGQLGLPLVLDSGFQGSGLVVADEGLSLCLLDKGGQFPRMRVNFTTKKWRRRIAEVGHEPLIRAMGKKRRGIPGKIIDATGGLGRDSFLLAAAGHEVLVYEREPLLALLVEDGLQRAALHPRTREIAARIRVMRADSCQELREMQKPPDIIYLDPMFPREKKSARVKKNLQIIRAVAGYGNDMETGALFTTALNLRPERLVVKRRRNSPFLTGLKPAYSLDGPTIRFDVYLPGKTEAPAR